ncbi:sigma factor [Arthrobacter alkaliphilus]|uniref:sigma factor n=1 Tax=Arthrobacter alkaliphilus TaxID=369936 RepID=UPI001F45CE7E|nr:sigma factor [Arthrobacter alkaliphilus]
MVNTMDVNARAIGARHYQPASSSIDISLSRSPDPADFPVQIDQIMVAVEGVRSYVVSRLSRIGRACDVDDVMQDIRMAVWDGIRRGHYRQLPGVRFEAWVQGVSANVCASHIRRELAHETLPLLVDPAGAAEDAPPDALAVLGIDRGWDGGADKAIDQDWARTIIALTRASVREDVWELALDSLTTPRQYGPPSAQDRRRWRAVTVVRHTARTVQNALDVKRSDLRSVEAVCHNSVECLPTPVLRRVAACIVRRDVRGSERTRVLESLATELGVTERYLAVQIGFARRLYQASWRILRNGMARAS